MGKTKLDPVHVTAEIAQGLKDIGFNELCPGRYTLGGDLQKLQSWRNSEVLGAAAPTWEQAKAFFRKEHKISVETIVNWKHSQEHDGWDVSVTDFSLKTDNPIILHGHIWSEYELAEECGIKRAIDYVKKLKEVNSNGR